MFTLKRYLLAESLEEAYEVLQKDKKNVILGGLLWLKMGKKAYKTGIDLSQLGLNTITETDTSIEIGCMTTLRQIEKSKVLLDYFDGILPQAVENIVGVQFRNCATIGGSIYSRFGFSDILTALLTLDSYVELYNGGVIALQDYVNSTYERDILVKIIIKKDDSRASYHSHRITATDFPVLAVAISRSCGKWKIAVGGRPAKAKLAVNAASMLTEKPTASEIESICQEVIGELNFGANIRGSAEYRKELAKVLVKRGVTAICE